MCPHAVNSFSTLRVQKCVLMVRLGISCDTPRYEEQRKKTCCLCNKKADDYGSAGCYLHGSLSAYSY